jgi:hypothetical protein
MHAWFQIINYLSIQILASNSNFNIAQRTVNSLFESKKGIQRVYSSFNDKIVMILEAPFTL